MNLVLDHGYVKLIETYGSDERIIEAARQSTNKGFLGWGDQYKPGDEKLLRYLYTNKHFTPFEMAGAIFEIKAPIMVFREWHRHRTQSYNEMSARYIPLPDENYIPSTERVLMSGGANKQAVGLKQMEAGDVRAWQLNLQAAYDYAQRAYDWSLRDGVPKELARLVLPVGRYSQMRANANLRNWLHFLELRMDEHAQWEIRQYANAVCDVLSDHFPRTMALFKES